MVPAELLDVIASLTAVTEDETGALVRPGDRAFIAETSAVKLRLAGAMEAAVARLARAEPRWLALIDGETRGRLAAAIAALLDASRANAEVLARQIELTAEMMAAVAAEARRLTGARHATYAAHGGLRRSDQPSPITLNARL